jgi:RimJ/RimL family protein N-acetyltransferase
VSTVETERLVLRPWTKADIGPLAAIFGEPAFWHYPFGRGLTREETETYLDRQLNHWADHGFGVWAAERKDDRRLIGYLGLALPTWLPKVMPAVEVGWRLHPDHWGRGLATEGGRASLRYGFDVLHLDRIIAIVMPENLASRRVMAKLEWPRCRPRGTPSATLPWRSTKSPERRGRSPAPTSGSRSTAGGRRRTRTSWPSGWLTVSARALTIAW